MSFLNDFLSCPAILLVTKVFLQVSLEALLPAPIPMAAALVQATCPICGLLQPPLNCLPPFLQSGLLKVQLQSQLCGASLGPPFGLWGCQIWLPLTSVASSFVPSPHPPSLSQLLLGCYECPCMLFLEPGMPLAFSLLDFQYRSFNV